LTDGGSNFSGRPCRCHWAGGQERPLRDDVNAGESVGYLGHRHRRVRQVSSTNDSAGFNLQTGGVTFGIDYRICSIFELGFNAGYANINADLLNGGSLDVNNGQFGLYATLFASGFYANAAFTWGPSAGSNFTVSSPRIGRDSLLIGAGTAVILSDRISVYAYYDGELLRSNYQSNSVSRGRPNDILI
jgi:uncharacterized protein with beta-barrel porin domain